jgi:hypothetical protein
LKLIGINRNEWKLKDPLKYIEINGNRSKLVGGDRVKKENVEIYRNV